MNRMTRSWRHASVALGFLAILALGACGEDDPTPATGVAPDFMLADVNPASPTAATEVSPRDYLGGVSAYYFGSAL